jgi:hypothetical protein
VKEVYWRRGAGRIPLRLFLVAPTPYRKRQSGRLYYRQAAYLLTTDLKHSARQLLQIYFDRWQIEVNHRDEKDTLGVGQAQLWNPDAVPKQPALVVAAYSALLLAALETFGSGRGAAYPALPKWRRKAHRASCLDLVTLLCKETVEHPEWIAPLGFQLTDRHLTQAAAATGVVTTSWGWLQGSGGAGATGWVTKFRRGDGGGGDGKFPCFSGGGDWQKLGRFANRPYDAHRRQLLVGVNLRLAGAGAATPNRAMGRNLSTAISAHRP